MMGQAKQRGTYEQRKAEGIAKRQEQLKMLNELRKRRGKSVLQSKEMFVATMLALAESKKATTP